MSKQLTREEWYADYQDYREAYGYKNASYNFIRCFLNWCNKTYPENPYLTQEMLDTFYVQQWWGGTFILNGDNTKCTKITLL